MRISFSLGTSGRQFFYFICFVLVCVCVSVAFGSSLFSTGFAVNLSETHIVFAQIAAMKQAAKAVTRKVEKAVEKVMKTMKGMTGAMLKSLKAMKAVTKKDKDTQTETGSELSKEMLVSMLQSAERENNVLRKHLEVMKYYRTNRACSSCGGDLLCDICDI